jgi:hypothetical protein
VRPVTGLVSCSAPHYLVSEGIADENVFETVKNHDLPSCVIKGDVHILSDSILEYAA